MTRVSEFDTVRRMMIYMSQNRQQVSDLGDSISSGISVHTAGDSTQAATIARTQESIDKIKENKSRVATVESYLTFQDSVLGSANTLLVRAAELAEQAANETNSAEARSQMASEVYEIRNNMVDLANSTYQGKYIYAGANDNTPPYCTVTTPANQGYVNPSSGEGSERYVFAYDIVTKTTDPADLVTRNVQLTDDVSVRVNTAGNKVFDNAIQYLERLGRSLEGYKTNPATGAPDGTGDAYTSSEYAQQTSDIQACLDGLNNARESDVMTERVDVAGRSRRLETADSIMDLTKTSASEVLDRLQNTDTVEAATQFSLAKTALQASIQVTTSVLDMSILDYL